jgi:agmatine deiminase
VGLNFNGWGGKQTVTKDRAVARHVASRARVPFTRAAFVGEGGAIETDGDGTVLATQSSLVNANRNPGMSRQEVEDAVLSAYGATKMLWVPGLRGRDITDDHIDATSRFIRPGVVMVQVPPESRTDPWAKDARRQFDILSSSQDARGRAISVIPMAGPTTVRSNRRGFLDSYVNFALAKGAVITAQFGDDEADRACRHTLRQAFPGRVVEQLNVDRLHEGGGGIHCITQQQPQFH